MIKEIKTGVTNALYQEFGDDYTIYTDPVKQGFEEPCFFVSIINIHIEDLIMGRRKVELPFNISYFPKSEDEPTDECLGVGQRLEDCLKFITLENGDVMRGTNIEMKIVDSVLQFYINYDHETVEPDTGIKMADMTSEVDYG